MRGARVKALRRKIAAADMPFTKNAKRAYNRLNAPPPCIAAPPHPRKRKRQPKARSQTWGGGTPILVRALYNDKRSPTFKGLTRVGRAKHRQSPIGPARVVPRRLLDRSKYGPLACFKKGKR